MCPGIQANSMYMFLFFATIRSLLVDSDMKSLCGLCSSDSLVGTYSFVDCNNLGSANLRKVRLPVRKRIIFTRVNSYI